MACFTLSKILPLACFRSLTSPTPGSRRCLRSVPSTPLDHFTLDLDCFAQSTSPPPALEHAVNLNRFARSMPPPPASEHAVDLDRFARSTPPPPAPKHAVNLDRFADALTGKIWGPVTKAKMGPMFMLIILYIAIEHTLQCIKKHTYYQIDA
jgi:hypothetical protein